MRTTTNTTLYHYWNSVRGPRMAPRRFEIEPSRIADILSETFILEYLPPASFHYRLAGTRICEFTGKELRATNFLEGWQDSDRFALQRHLTSVRKLGAVARILVEGTSDETRPRFEILILPMLHNGDAIDRFLGGFVAIDPPAWLGPKTVSDFRIVETELTYPADGFEFPDPVLRTEPSREAPPVLAHIRSARIVRQDRRQFRVYEGGLSEPRDQK